MSSHQLLLGGTIVGNAIVNSGYVIGQGDVAEGANAHIYFNPNGTVYYSWWDIGVQYTEYQYDWLVSGAAGNFEIQCNSKSPSDTSGIFLPTTTGWQTMAGTLDFKLSVTNPLTSGARTRNFVIRNTAAESTVVASNYFRWEAWGGDL